MSCAGHSGLAAFGSVRPLCALVRIDAYEWSTDRRPAIQRASVADGGGSAGGHSDSGGVRLGASSAALGDRAKKTEGVAVNFIRKRRKASRYNSAENKLLYEEKYDSCKLNGATFSIHFV